MEIIIDKTRLDSTTYRKIFEFIKREGIEPFEKLLADIDEIDEPSLVSDAVLWGKQPLIGLYRKNRTVVEFLRQFNAHFFHQTFGESMDINGEGFYKFIAKTAENIGLLDTYIENAKLLEELRICRVEFDDLKSRYFLSDTAYGKTRVWTKNGHVVDIRKSFSDGLISYFPIKESSRSERNESYEEFEIRIAPKEDAENSPTFLIQTDNHISGNQCRYALLTSFDINVAQLPTDEELSSYKIPQTLKLYKKSTDNV